MLRCIAKFITFIILITSVCYTLAETPINPEFIGTWEGSGRTCYGTLTISPKRFSWKAPYKSIKNAPYEIIEQVINESQCKIIIRLKSNSKKWGLPIIRLRKDLTRSEYAWNAIAFKSIEDCQTDNHDSFICVMFKR